MAAPADGQAGAVSEPSAAKQKPRGQPFQRGNQHGKGRPGGSANKSTLMRDALLDEHGTSILRKMLQMAFQGNTVALRLAVERVCPPKREDRIRLQLPDLRSPDGPAGAFAGVLAALSEGRISVEHSLMVCDMIYQYAKTIGNGQLEGRLAALEQRQTETGPPEEVMPENEAGADAADDEGHGRE
jgi:hypothetical protein